MDKKILLSNTSGNADQPAVKKDTQVKPNLFRGKPEAENNKAVFPDWDIVPPSLIINPRIKQR